MNKTNKESSDNEPNVQALAPSMAVSETKELDKNLEAIDGCQQCPCSVRDSVGLFTDEGEKVLASYRSSPKYYKRMEFNKKLVNLYDELLSDWPEYYPTLVTELENVLKYYLSEEDRRRTDLAIDLFAISNKFF